MTTPAKPSSELQSSSLPPFDEPIEVPTEDDLPFEDGRVHNHTEDLQTALLRDTSNSVLTTLHPDGKYLVAADSGIYYRLGRPIEESRCLAPDWYYVPGVPQMRSDGRPRKSYLLWENPFPPLIVIELASDGGADERDATPETGKFWIYENCIRPTYYAIFVPSLGQLEVYEHVRGEFAPMRCNVAGRYPIARMGMELGVWHGNLDRTDADWIRWWLPDGSMIPSSAEQVEEERRRAEEASRRAESLAAKLRALGIDPDAA